jgi:(1->4)-alpha-D-glucan 1-alpha-D-glucosylmutase
MAATADVQALAVRTAEALRCRRRSPESTYRVHFHKEFRFRDAAAIVDYLAALGVSDLYASPYLKARPGSRHGYDISDHAQLNPEIGTDEDYAALVQALHARGMGQVLDVVPNHMGIMGNENAWWNDVLENGPASPYAGYFDIAWHSPKPDLDDRVLLPVLGDPYGKALESSHIQLAYESGAFLVRYFDNVFPVSPSTYDQILRHGLEAFQARAGAEHPDCVELLSILTAIAHLPPTTATDPKAVTERHREKEVVKRRIKELAEKSPAFAEFVHKNVARFNGADGDRHSFDLLDGLLNAQAYRLSSWRVASDEINYRRFFDINELAALSMEKPEVFAATHERIFRMLREGQVNGLRIDHPDGLFDPKQYLQRLQARCALEIAGGVAPDGSAPPASSVDGTGRAVGAALAAAAGGRPLYVVVEKILGKDEPLPADWPVDGTTGYDFLHALNDLFVDRSHAKAFTQLYQQWTGMTTPLRDLIYQKKYLTMQVSLSGELQMLAAQLDRLSEGNRWSRDFTLNMLRRALREVIACFDVYRTYITGPEVSPRDRQVVERAVARAKRLNPALSGAVFDFVRDVILLRTPEDATADYREQQLRFVGKFQQLTAPVMAKGFEDTVFYVYNRLLSLNEVGGDPGQFGASLETFHERNRCRQRKYPRALSATATHDTKRGEDARARLNVLSEMPADWKRAVSRWYLLNKRYKQVADDERLPDRNEEYFLYQTLVGAWPSPPPSGPEDFVEFTERIQLYMQKAVHEAKVRTSWINPNPVYDEAVRRFVARVLSPDKNARFLADFAEFHAHVEHYGLFNGLSQVLLKAASPGVPDVYQGTELWDFSLVDPDNRRPFDYARRRQLLADLDAAAANDRLALARELLAARADGRIKLYVLSRALRCRREHPGLFAEGDYEPATAAEPFTDNVCAFLRRRGAEAALAVAPRLLRRVVRPGELPIGPAWRDAVLYLPDGAPRRCWRDVFTGATLTSRERDGRPCLQLGEVFGHLPVALLRAEGGS